MADEDTVYSRHIILNGLPGNVTPDKRAIFQRHAERKFADLLGHSSFNLLLLSDRETGLVSGAFMTFATESDAEAALAKLNLYHFTRSDTVQTYRWAALARCRGEPEEYVPPVLPEETTDGEDFSNNMAEDQQARPQFLVKGGLSLDCEWYWFDWEKQEPVLYRRPNVRKDDSIGKWCELDRRHKTLRNGLVSSLQPVVRPMPTWSTYGTMMVSEHDSGLRIWGGRTMGLLFEIPEDVVSFMVSPCEKFIVIQTANDLSVWNLRTARKIRTLGNLDLHTDDLWPITRFSSDDSLVAVCKTGYHSDSTDEVGIGKLNIYVSERMRVVQGSDNAPTSHTFAIPGLYKADWNPAIGTQIAYVSFLGQSQGWKVVVANINYNEEDNLATESVLIQRNFVKATGLDMLWHPAGTYLSVKVTLKKSVEYCLLHIMPRTVASIQLCVKANHSASRFAWQPAGSHFAIILEKDAVAGASAISQLSESSVLQIHSLSQKKPKVLHEITTSATHLYWAPKGAHLVAVNFNKSILHFFHINDNGIVLERAKLANISGTDAQWDPTGRFFATWVSSLRNTTMAPQYRIFDYNGNQLFQKQTKPFSHLMWRPLPPTLLSEDDVKTVKESMKMLVHEYESVDQQRSEEEKAKLQKVRRDQEDAYTKKMDDLARKMRSQKLTEERITLQENSCWSKYWRVRVQNLPEEDRMIHEDVVEERITSRRQV